MLTQSAPSIVNALSGVLPDNAVKALLQAIGNCNQPLSHRGPVNLQAPPGRQTGPGTYGPGGWDPSQYADILPNTSDDFDANMPGWGAAGGANSHNFYGDTFNFPTSQEFLTNQYFGGPNFYSAGNSYFENIVNNNLTTENHSVTNLNVTYINGVPVEGPAGRPGAAGERGRDGLPGGRGRDGRDGRDAVLPPPKPAAFVAGVAGAPTQIQVPKYKFDANTCTVVQDGVQQITFTPVLNVNAGVINYYGP